MSELNIGDQYWSGSLKIVGIWTELSPRGDLYNDNGNPLCFMQDEVVLENGSFIARRSWTVEY